MPQSARVSPSELPWFRLLAAPLSCATLLFLALSATRADSQGEDMAPDRFLREYRDAVRNLQSLYADVSVTGEHRVAVARAKCTQFTYSSSGKKEKLHLWREEPEYFDRVFVSAEDRRFQVSRSDRSASYHLENVSDPDEVWRPGLRLYKALSQGAAYCPGGLSEFPGFVNSPEFVIKRVSPVSEEGLTVLNVDFEFNPSQKDKLKVKGWLRVNPQRALVIRSYDFEFRSAILQGKKAGQELVFHRQGQTDYKGENGKPVPTESHSILSLRGKVVRDEYLTFSKFSFARVPSAEFTLTAFGLGDIERTARVVETRNNYWTAALAVAAILISLLLFRAGRSFQKRRANAKVMIPAAGPSLGGSAGGQGT